MTGRVVVIGAGIGGLAAAAWLAKTGRKVLVVEARPGPGGLASGFTADGHAFDGGPYILLDRPGLEWVFHELGEELSSHVTLRRIDAVYQVQLEDGPCIRVYTDLDRTCGEVDQIWPGAGARYSRFVEEMGRAYRSLQPPCRELDSPGSVGQFLRYIRHPCRPGVRMLETAMEALTNGCRLRVARQGEGEPIICLHGYPDNLQIWSPLARQLSEAYQVIAFDWPGMGRSDPWPGGATPMNLAERLGALLDDWKMERATLLGADMGGQPALVFAAKYPERVKGLIVMNCLAFPEEETSWEIRILRQYGWNRIIIRYLPLVVFRRAERTFLPKGFRVSRDVRQDMWGAFRRKEVRQFIVRMCAGYQGSLRLLPHLYSRIACRTLILWGQEDKHFPPVHAHKLHKAIPGSRLRVISGGEHWMAYYLADEVARHVRDFMDHEP